MDASTFHQDLVDQHKANALRKITKLERALSDLRASIEVNNRPFSSLDGDLHLVGSALDVQREVDSWISAATSVTVIQHLAKKG